MQEIPVSVTITNWNGEHYLEDCIRAVLDQSYPAAEVILVDNNSDDDSVPLVKRLFPEVRIVVLQKNEGPSPARNAGLKEARHDWVLSIDNDAILDRDCLARLVRGVEEGVAVVHPRSLMDQERDRVHYDGASMHFVGMMTLHNFYGPLKDAHQEPRDLDAAISVALLLQRNTVLDCGAYDAAHFILFEDHDLSYRIRSRGWRIRHMPDALVFHREGTAGISFRDRGKYTPRRVFLHSRNRWIVILKNHSWRAILLGLPGLFLYEGAYLFFATKNGSLGAWLRGKGALVKLLPHIMKERRIVQKARTVRDRDLLGAAPLTISPLIERRGFTARAQGMLDSLLRC